MDIEKIWAAIASEVSRQGATLSDMKLLESGFQSEWGEILLGVDSKGRRHLVVPAPADASEEQDDSSRGIRVELRPYVTENQQRLYCDVSCRLEELNEMFATVASDMINELQEGGPDESPFSVCLRVLERWRRLLERLPTRLMSRTAQAGLLGELLFLRKLADNHAGAIQRWVGPKGGRHDFVSETVDVEVKVSLSAERRKVHIQSLQQLDISAPAKLYLQFFALREPVGQGICIPELIDELLVKGINSVDLHDRLSDAGYSPTDRQSYSRTRFETVEELTFRVDASDFPRLTPSALREDVPQGVLGVSYDVDLDLAGIKPVSDNEREQMLRTIVS